MQILIEECTERSSRWLEKIQNQNDGGWGEYKGVDSNSLNTAEAILALIESGCNNAGDQSIQNGVKYLINQQLTEHNCDKPEDYGTWSKNVTTKNGKIIRIPDTLRTSFALLALNTAGKSLNDNTVLIGVQWLIRIQNVQGGWGYKSNDESRLFPTCLALNALFRMYSAGDKKLKDKIEKGLDHISETYRNSEDGSFGKQYGLEVSHTLHVIHTFQVAMRQDFNISKKYLQDAINWIQHNKENVVRWSTETILVGSDSNSPYNYTFSHINPALYLTFVGKDLTPDDDIFSPFVGCIGDHG